jgi:DNA-binding NarL/FixJ family response regulator
MPPTTLLLADDHQLFREGLRALIGRFSGFEIVAETGDGNEALTLVTERRPGIAILDIGLPGLNGIEIALRIRDAGIETRTVILSAHSDEEYVQQALKAGVSAYLAKDSTLSELDVALRAVERGASFLSPTIAGRLTRDYIQRVGDGDEPLLTPRQRQILRLVAEGNNTKEIAFQLGLSVKTVETHRSEVMERLQIHDVAGLTRYAIRKGLVSSER